MLPGYWQQTVGLGPDPDGEGDLVATLVRRGEPDPAHPAPAHAVLLVHGFTDYFFNTELADHFAGRGFAFYALDLHKCGRSWREGQTPHFTTTWPATTPIWSAQPTSSTPDKILLYGHSAGGLIVSLWLDRLRRRGLTAQRRIAGLVLNSPWLDLQGPAILRTAGTAAALGAVSRIRKRLVARPPTEGGYGATLHRDYHGDFDYDLKWKPIGGFPVTFGWLHAIRRGHTALHRGLDVGVPNLILRSDRSVREVKDPEAIQRGDAVLDVKHIARWAGCIGNRTTIVPILDAKHDVFLSLAEPRQAAYRELDRWLDWYLSENTGAAAQSKRG